MYRFPRTSNDPGSSTVSTAMEELATCTSLMLLMFTSLKKPFISTFPLHETFDRNETSSLNSFDAVIT